MSDGREQSGLAWVSGIYAGIDVSREIIESSSILQDTWYLVRSFIPHPLVVIMLGRVCSYHFNNFTSTIHKSGIQY